MKAQKVSFLTVYSFISKNEYYEITLDNCHYLLYALSIKHFNILPIKYWNIEENYELFFLIQLFKTKIPFLTITYLPFYSLFKYFKDKNQ